jgi:hypothetical protein
MKNWEPDCLASCGTPLLRAKGLFSSCFKDRHYTINKQLKGLIEDLLQEL